MPMSFLSRFRIKADKIADFVALIPQIEAISAEEPDTLGYKFYRLEEPGMFAVFESFTNADADVAHQQNPKLVGIIDDILACMDGSYTREYLNDIEQVPA